MAGRATTTEGGGQGTKPPVKRRRSVTLAVTPAAERVLARSRAETGITQVALLERLLVWFAAQDPRLRTMILSPYPEVHRGLAKLLAEEAVAGQPQENGSVTGVHELIDHDYDGS